MPNVQSRQKLSPPDLIALLNWELAAYEECEGCRVTAIEPVPGSWKATASVDNPEKRRIVEKVFAQTREQFDVQPPALLPRQVA